MELNQFIGHSKGVLTVISFDLSEEGKTNKKNIKANCICARCGKTIKYPLSKLFSSSKFLLNCCPECKEDYRIENLKFRHVGKTHGVLTVLDFDHFKNGKAYLKCKCNRCGKETIVRDDRFCHVAPQSCEHCYYDLLGRKTHSRYMKMYNFNSDKEFYEN